MSSVSPLDASILALLSKVPKQVKGRQREIVDEISQTLIDRLSSDAREIGQAVLADDDAGFSASAQATAQQMKRWARANKSR